jgi:hypothetical protein
MNLLANNVSFVYAHNNGQLATITETALGFIPLLTVTYDPLCFTSYENTGYREL